MFLNNKQRLIEKGRLATWIYGMTIQFNVHLLHLIVTSVSVSVC